MQPTIIYKQRVSGLSRRALSEFVDAACRIARLRGTVTVMITSNREIRALNLRFKGTDFATDVLSFPAPSFVRGFSGDIAISAEFAARQARKVGHRISDEVRILALHGVLHLAGYDHENDNGEMVRREERMRKKLNLPAGLIERNRRMKKGTAAQKVRVAK